MERILAEVVEFEFGSGINPEHAEAVIQQLDRDDHATARVLLRFVGYPYVNPGVGWRIGNALRRYSGRVEADVPTFGKGDWFRSFTRSGLGDAIAAHAGVIRSDRADITEDMKRFYRDHAVRNDQNAIFIGELHRGLRINPEREDLFRDTFLGSLRNVNSKPSDFTREHLLNVVKLCFEAIQNVYDHACRKPLPEGAKVLSYFLLGYYKSVGGHPDPTGRLRTYVEALAATMGRRRTDFVQVCVNDDGVGIAARHAQSLEIYSGPKEREVAAVAEALRASGSVKFVSKDSRVRGTPGQGYSYIHSCLRELRAFAVLRTGRLLAVFDGSGDATDGFMLVPGNLGLSPGTTLDVLIPLLKDPPIQPSLFS